MNLLYLKLLEYLTSGNATCIHI